MATEQPVQTVTEQDRRDPDEGWLHIGAGNESPRDAVTMDKVDYGHTDIVQDLRNPWPFVDDCFQAVVGNHVLEHLSDPVPVFKEAARVLEPRGQFIVRVPIGVDARADPTHEMTWTWRTPEFYGVDAKPWQPGATHALPFRVVQRDLRVWTHWHSRLCQRVYQWLADRRPMAAQDLPGASGELTVRFEVVDR